MAISKHTPRVGLGGRVQSMRSKSIYDLMSMVGFDPSDAGSEWLVILADIHFDAVGGVQLLTPALKAEILSYAANPPTRIVINGDVLSYYVAAMGEFGNTTYGNTEGGWAAPEMNALAAIAPLKITTGNHDSGSGETIPGTFLASKISQFTTGYSSEVLGGVRVSYLNLTGGGWLTDAQYTPWQADMATLTPGQEMVTFHHHRSVGRVGQSGMAIRYGQALDTLPSLDNKLWSISGHDHLFNDQFFSCQSATLCVWVTTTGYPSRSYSSDQTGPGMAAILLRGGKVVARLAMDAKDLFWNLWLEPSAPTVTALPQPLDGLTEPSMATYLEGSYTRDFLTANSGSTWRDCENWLTRVQNLVARFTVPSGANSIWMLWTNVGTVELSADNVSWTPVTMSAANLGITTAIIPAPLLNVTPLYVRVTSASADIGGWGFIQVPTETSYFAAAVASRYVSAGGDYYVSPF